MGKQIHYAFLAGPLLGWALQYGTQDFENREGARVASSAYEKVLGDFDVSAHLYERIKQRLESVTLLRMVLEEDPQRADQIIRVVAADEGGQSGRSVDWEVCCVAAFKISYGLGAREGAEQIGFRKYYRPFIRILGQVKRADTNTVIWRQLLIVFTEKRYLGSEADSDRIPKDELVQAFKHLSEEVTNLLIRSLNGEELPEMPVLVGTSAADNRF